jgi:hypothetical protein
MYTTHKQTVTTNKTDIPKSKETENLMVTE